MNQIPVDTATSWNSGCLSPERHWVGGADTHPPTVVFNTPEWAQIIAECYGFEDCSIRCGAASLPLFHTRSPLLGRKLVSAVFNTYAAPIYETAEQCEELLRRASALAHARRVDFLEIKSLVPLPETVVSRLQLITRHPYKETVIPLGDYRAVLAGYDRKFRRNLRVTARRLAKAGIRIARSCERPDLEQFYHLLVRRYRDKHLMIAQPFKLFAAVFERFVLAGKGHLWIAKTTNDAILGGLLFAIEGGIVSGLFGAAVAAPELSLDTALKSAAIEFYCDAGYALCDFGITSATQTTVLFSKSRFNGLTYDLPYYYLPVRRARVPELDFADSYLWLRRPFRYMPVPMARGLSALIVRYLN